MVINYDRDETGRYLITVDTGKVAMLRVTCRWKPNALTACTFIVPGTVDYDE